MKHHLLTETEKAFINREISWTKEYEVIHATPVRKLLRSTSPQDMALYFTLISKPEPYLIYHEPVRFSAAVHAAKGDCRAGHKIGDRWEFDWCTPAGLCGSAFHTMYPLLHGLSLTSGRYNGPATSETLISCPDEGWITFRIERHRWTPDVWEAEFEG